MNDPAAEIVAPGTIVGEYIIADRLGEGGFGAVYRGHHPVIGKTAAIKVLHRAYSANPEIVERFVAEARSVNQIRHRNIIDIFSFGTLSDGRQFFVMELLDGMTLDALIKQRGRLTISETMAILKPLGRALSAAHQAGIAHRDLKPENVFITFDDDKHPIPKLLDFGIAKLMVASDTRSKTQSGVAMGSPLYMAPEQVQGSQIDHRADIYALGSVIFEMLTGGPPFDGETAMAVMIKQVTEPAPHPSSVCSDVPPALDGPILAMLAKSPDERPGSVAQAIGAVEQAARTCGLVTDSAPLQVPSLQASDPSSSASAVSGLGNTVAGTSMRSKTRSSARRTWLVALAILLPAIVGIALYLRDSRRPKEIVTGQQPTQAPAESTPARSPLLTASVAVQPEQAQTVRVTIAAVPSDADVYRGDKAVGKASASIEFPRSSEEIALTLKKDGYRSEEVRLIPSADVNLQIKLVALPQSAPPANTWGKKW